MTDFFKKHLNSIVIVIGILTTFFLFSLAILITPTLFSGILTGVIVCGVFSLIIYSGIRSLRVRKILHHSGAKFEDDFILFWGNEKLWLSKVGIEIPFALTSRTAIAIARDSGWNTVFIKWSDIKSWEIRTEGHVIETTFLLLIKRTPELIQREKEFISKVLSEAPCPVKICTDSFKE